MAHPATILVVDDDRVLRDVCSNILRLEGYRCDVAATPGEALQKVREDRTIGVVCTDLRMPEMSGADLLRRVKEVDPSIEVIVLTGHGSIESAVECVKYGAVDYITKPFAKDRLIAAVEKAARLGELQREVQRLRSELREKYRFEHIVGRSAAMNVVFDRMSKACQTDSTVLVLGESGTGKELVARAVHYNSNRAKNPFIPVNCAALPKELIESELFGHRKGAFTGAINDNVGLFRAAHGGTIFLDEVVEMPQSVQAKLLRTLQERTIRPVGGAEEVKVDVRVIAATNLDVNLALKDGTLRSDLYYRLAVITITLPPLRDRREDIPAIVERLLERLNSDSRRKVGGVDRRAYAALMAYDWPGNVRELENVIESAFAMGHTDRIMPDDLPPHLAEHRPKRTADVFEGDKLPTLEEAERLLIERALALSNGNKSTAARMLGISRKRLYRRLESFGVDGSPSRRTPPEAK